MVTTYKTAIAPTEVHSTLAKHLLIDGFKFVWDYKHSQGSYLVDAVTGRSYIDFFSFFASAPIGYNHPKMRDPEFREKLADIAAVNPANSEVYTVEMAEFVETFTRLAIPPELPHLFFIAGGAPAVENALKVAFDWKVRKNFERGYTTERGHKVIHFKEAFHGRLGYSLGLTNTADPRKYQYYPRFEWPRVDNPKIRFPLDLAQVEEAERETMRQIEAAFEQNQAEIAAIIIEPIQAEGGDNHFRPAFFHELRRLADEREALLIFDEIQTGMGLTGTWWAHQQLGVSPDVLVFGKKAQVCGIAASRRIDEVPHNVFVEPSRINSTWGGNLVDMVRSQRYLEIIAAENLLDNAREQGAYILEQLHALAARAGKISNLRGCGLMIAFDLPGQAERDRVLELAFEQGLLLLPCGTHSIRLRPHLDISRAVLDEAFPILERVLDLIPLK